MTSKEKTKLLSAYIDTLSKRPETFKREEQQVKFKLDADYLNDEVFNLDYLSELLGVKITYVRVRDNLITVKYSIADPITSKTSFSELVSTSPYKQY